jgi:guanylate kinase
MENQSAFIITITGPSGSGKTYITDQILSLKGERDKGDNEFNPIRYFKYVTRPYRDTEIIKRNQYKKEDQHHRTDTLSHGIDVVSVPFLPLKQHDDDNGCDLIYRTYGEDYGVNSNDLRKILECGESPILVINDVRVVEELKRKFEKKVLSLFLFRDIIPDRETHIQTGAARGAEKQSITRFEKAVALYRIFIENNYLFDRVILNTEITDLDGKQSNFAYIQTKNLIMGILQSEIELGEVPNKGPKLFIISGNAESGKDYLVQSTNKMGKLQADIVIKYTSRWQEADDEDEIICKFKPKQDILDKYEGDYSNECKKLNNLYQEKQSLDLSKYTEKYLAFLNSNPGIKCSFEEYCNAVLEKERLDLEKKIPSAKERFWEQLKYAQDKLKGKENSGGAFSKADYEKLLSKCFEKNDKYLDVIDEIIEKFSEGIDSLTYIDDNHPSKKIQYNGKDYIYYKNNVMPYGDSERIDYIFEISSYRKQLNEGKLKDGKHIVLTASLPNMFKLCRDYFGPENVITAYSYSQISIDEHRGNTDRITGEAKVAEYNDLKRYSDNIVYFNYAMIYAETSLNSNEKSTKDELVDQLFRLFRFYNQ